MKCVFLKVRNPSIETCDDFIRKITGDDDLYHSDESQGYFKHMRKAFTNYRNKFNDSIQELITLFKDSRERYIYIILYNFYFFREI